MTHPVWRTILLVTMFAALPLSAAAQDDMAAAEALHAKGDLASLKAAAGLYETAAQSPDADYELLWKCARACRDYGNTAKKQMAEGWKPLCAQYGKKGMDYAYRAKELEPEKADGHYYYGLSVGVYSDGVSILTALKEGLKNKTQASFEKAYEIDKTYNEAGPVLSLGRFWAVLPWPLKDKKKSLQYYREFQTTPHFDGNTEAHVYLAELLLDIGGKDNRTEARAMLEKAAGASDPFWRQRARSLLEEK